MHFRACIPTVYLLAAARGVASACPDNDGSGESPFRYSTDIRGIFAQEDPGINANPTTYADISMGLLNRSYVTDASFDPSGQKTQWERFANYVQSLNAKGSSPNAKYKVLFLARHGEAYHNVAQTYYGSCWECYWAQQAGNGTATWQDAELTPKGYSQVASAREFWRSATAVAKIPVPQSFYASPMARCLATANETFSTLPGLNGNPFSPVVKELLRETINACTCSWRHSKSWIHQRFPSYGFEQGFAEEDGLWRAGVVVESPSAQLVRVRKLLDDVFSSDANPFISFTTHGVVVAPLLQVIGYPNAAFNLTTGQAIPVLVKAERLDVPESLGAGDPPAPAKTCPPCSP